MVTWESCLGKWFCTFEHCRVCEGECLPWGCALTHTLLSCLPLPCRWRDGQQEGTTSSRPRRGTFSRRCFPTKWQRRLESGQFSLQFSMPSSQAASSAHVQGFTLTNLHYISLKLYILNNRGVAESSAVNTLILKYSKNKVVK